LKNNILYHDFWLAYFLLYDDCGIQINGDILRSQEEGSRKAGAFAALRKHAAKQRH